MKIQMSKPKDGIKLSDLAPGSVFTAGNREELYILMDGENEGFNAFNLSTNKTGSLAVNQEVVFYPNARITSGRPKR